MFKWDSDVNTLHKLCQIGWNPSVWGVPGEIFLKGLPFQATTFDALEITHIGRIHMTSADPAGGNNKAMGIVLFNQATDSPKHT